MTVEITLPHDSPGDLEDFRREMQAKMPGHVTVRVSRADPPDPRVTLTAKHPTAGDIIHAVTRLA